MLYCMMLLYNVYVCLLKFLRKFVNVWGMFCFCFFVFLNNPCYITVLYVVQCYVFFVGIYFECATWLIFIY